MDKEKEIEQIQFIALNAVGKKYNSVEMMKANYCGKGDKGFYEESKALVEAGYHKTIWHKVVDGDLPEYAGSYLIICEDGSLPEYYVDFYENFWYGKRWVYNEGRVIAWTYLPEYKE